MGENQLIYNLTDDPLWFAQLKKKEGCQLRAQNISKKIKFGTLKITLRTL
jgi:hypothetical protein